MARVTRRSLAAMTLGAATFAASRPEAASEVPMVLGNAATYSMAIGTIRVTAVSDGQIAFPAWPTYAPDATEADVHTTMTRYGLKPPDYRLDANALLVETASETILIDTGWGRFDPRVGRLKSNLAAIGIEPGDIDLVVLSHVHPDHVGGLRDADGTPSFPKAGIVLAEAEWAQWRDGPDFGAMTVDDAFKPVFAAAAETVAGFTDRLMLLADGADIASGLSLVSMPGHTRGHSGVQIESESNILIYAADLFHDPAFDLANPGWRTAFDYDPPLAEESRRRLLDRAAADGAQLMAYHMPFPGIGTIGPNAGGYIWHPQRWAPGPEE
ncbi:MAG: MBL fold metallo-hydrolase [Pseudomonadota bacterium]